MNPTARTVLVALPLLAAGCATTEVRRRDWSDYAGPGAESFRREELELPSIHDPAEPVNRAVDEVKHAAARYVAAPVGAAWRFVLPKDVRDAVTRFGKNAATPVRLVSNLLQGEWADAGTETERFAINTTVGLLGLADAADCLGVPAPRPQDTGLALRSAGWKESAYTSLPAATVRDDVGFVADMFLDPLTYFPPAGPVVRVNDMSEYVDRYVEFTRTTYDPFRLERMVRALDRQLEPTDEEFAAGFGGGVDTLQYVFLAPLDPEFVDEATEGTARIAATGRDLGYRAWFRDGPAPVVYVLPGTGGHHASGSAAALAEIAWRAGCHAVVVSSTLCFDFIESAGTSDFPGFAPADAGDVRVALTAVDADVRRRLGSRLVARRAVLGISLGGMHALFLAAHDEADRAAGLVPLDAYVALNPPVSLLRAARGLDAYYNIPLTHIPDPDRRAEKVRALFRHVIDVAGSNDLQPGRPLPLNDLQARFLVGIAFRMTLLDVLDQARSLGRGGDAFLTPRTAWDRSASYEELAGWSFEEYVWGLVLPEQARRRADLTNDDAGARRLEEVCDLRSLAPRLEEDARIGVFTNENDLLVDPSDVDFLRATFGTRLELSSDGGHLGNLWRPEVRERIGRRLRALVGTE